MGDGSLFAAQRPRRWRTAHDIQPCCSQRLRLVWAVTNNTVNPALSPIEAPNPRCSGRTDTSRRVTATLSNTGITAAITGGHGRSSANNERDVISIRLQPTRLGPNAKKADATNRVDSAVKLPCW